MAVVDAAVRRFDFVDADHLGFIGGSNVGFVTSSRSTASRKTSSSRCGC
jgi:hypothetical protein